MVLVTGGTGLLGTHLICELHKQGVAVKAIYRSHIPIEVKDKATWIPGDILDVTALEEVLQDVNQVYHCAGFVSFAPQDKAMLHKINIEGTANIVNACLDAGIDKLVHVSSVAALGRLHIGDTIDEKMQWSEKTSNSEYGKTKFLAEMEVWRGVGEGLNAAIVNPSIIIGEYGDWEKGSMAIFKKVHSGFKWYSTGSTGFVDAADVARAMTMLMNSSITAQRYVVSAENMVYRDMFWMIADAFGMARPNKQVTPMVAALVWRLEKLRSMFTGKRPLITKETTKTALAPVSFSSAKLMEAFPQFAFTPIRQSVQRICSYLKEVHKH
jgi:nucleoside-diphosphate-sugar epimerase